VRKLELLVAVSVLVAAFAAGIGVAAASAHRSSTLWWCLTALAVLCATAIPGYVSLGDAPPEARSVIRERLGRWSYAIAPFLFVLLVLIVIGYGVRFIVHMSHAFHIGFRDG
jgi:hypothetical protein